MAANIFKYMVVLAGLMLLFNLSGITITDSTILNDFNIEVNSTTGIFQLQNTTTSSLFDTYKTSVNNLLVAGGIILTGFAFFLNQKLTITVAMSLLIFGFIGDFFKIVAYINATCPVGSSCVWVSNLVGLIMSVIIIGAILSLIDWTVSK